MADIEVVKQLRKADDDICACLDKNENDKNPSKSVEKLADAVIAILTVLETMTGIGPHPKHGCGTIE